MDNLDDSENNAKISDSAYSNSCSNSQSRRSRSSKSTHSGSHSSGSSGYGGKPSTDSSNTLSKPLKKEKGSKKKKQTQIETLKEETDVECIAPNPEPANATPLEIQNDVVLAPSQAHAQKEKKPESMGVKITDRIISKDEVTSTGSPMLNATINFVTSRPAASFFTDGFSCIISMEDGIVMYTTASLTTTLGFPKDMWIGRSFIDFIHPKDRKTFASQITSGIVVPKIVNGTQKKDPGAGYAETKMVCRIRRYKGLRSGFNVKDRVVIFMPFSLKFTFKNVCDDGGKVIYLILQATAFSSAFRTPNEVVMKTSPFVIRHSANGILEYIDPESVPYLGYLPQDIIDKDVLQLYHPDDLSYLKEVYETIVKEGGLERSNPYRLETQNGNFVKVETEWSSFINPWSKKLEFVIAKHYIIEGPANPDVFQTPDPDKALNLSEDDQKQAQMLRESIIKVLNEMLTKPAELAKQQMNKRCQDLTTFMEGLLNDHPKNDDELRLEIQDADQSYYERDSVMLGGISPHHEYNDSKSSTETPLSYNQLNYNETLQRYFDSHQSFVANTTVVVDIPPVVQPTVSNGPSPKEQIPGNSGEVASPGDSSAVANANSTPLNAENYEPMKLTDSLLIKHNVEMEKELKKTYRENRLSISKEERDKGKNETRQKKKEHFARCNAQFQPTTAGILLSDLQPHGLKRSAMEPDVAVFKHHCTTSRQLRDHQSPAPVQTSANIPSTVASTQWLPNPANSMNMNTFFLGVGIPQQMPLVGTLPAMPGMVPMYCPPATVSVPTTSQVSNVNTSNANPPYQPPMSCMMYGQPIYGSPFMYSPMASQVSYPMPHQPLITQNVHFASALNPLSFANHNVEAAYKSASIAKAPEMKRVETTATKTEQQEKADTNITSNALNREAAEHASDNGNKESTLFPTNVKSTASNLSLKSTEPVPGPSVPRDVKKTNKPGNSEGTVERTDEESSYSSFYSSFFKTESGSAEDSNDTKRNKDKSKPDVHSDDHTGVRSAKQVPKRRKDPPWMEQVCVTSELIYKYHIVTKPTEEVLLADKNRMKDIEQPALVNEQLNQLYLDLQLQGVASRLTLEEGFTSSSSSVEDLATTTTTTNSKTWRKKRDYGRYAIIHEENAPLPSPSDHEMADVLE